MVYFVSSQYKGTIFCVFDSLHKKKMILCINSYFFKRGEGNRRGERRRPQVRRRQRAAPFRQKAAVLPKPPGAKKAYRCGALCDGVVALSADQKAKQKSKSTENICFNSIESNF